jgi:two-component system response regulator
MENYHPVEILLVEDNPIDVELTMRALKKNNLANKIVVAEDGQEALDFLFCRGKFIENSEPQHLKVIFLDLKMPKMNGLEVLKAIKSAPQTKRIPVVVVTSSKEDPDIKTAYEHGANAYVVKPVDFNNFVNAMQNTGLFWLLVNETSK